MTQTEVQLNIEKQKNLELTRQLESANHRADAKERRGNELQFAIEQLELQYSARFQNMAMVRDAIKTVSDNMLGVLVLYSYTCSTAGIVFGKVYVGIGFGWRMAWAPSSSWDMTEASSCRFIDHDLNCDPDLCWMPLRRNRMCR
eukprot:5710744-Pyramimonas_sp.AAC.3